MRSLINWVRNTFNAYCATLNDCTSTGAKLAKLSWYSSIALSWLALGKNCPCLQQEDAIWLVVKFWHKRGEPMRRRLLFVCASFTRNPIGWRQVTRRFWLVLSFRQPEFSWLTVLHLKEAWRFLNVNVCPQGIKVVLSNRLGTLVLHFNALVLTRRWTKMNDRGN